LLSGWAQQGVESYLATQRVFFDLAMRQGSSVMHGLQDRLSSARHSSITILAELAGDGMSHLVEAQRVLLDLGQRQNEIAMAGVKERMGGYSTVVALSSLLRRSVDTVVEMQKEFLKIADKQTHTWMETAKTGKTPKADILVDLARAAMENFVSAEKRFLDVVAEETDKATRSRHANGGGKKIKKTELAEFARQATESFIEAQKKLLDVAGRQVKANLKTASQTMAIMEPPPLESISDWTREGVKSFVDAQKVLLDVVTKPRNGSKPAPKARRTAKPFRSAKAKTARAAGAAV
jgi:hypothetical protein